MYIYPSMGLNASCFFGVQKNTCQPYHPAYHSPVSFSHTLWHRHRKRWASVTDVGPAIIQHWFNAYCLVCLANIGLEHCWASFNPLTASAAYIRVFMFYKHIKYHILNMLKIKCDINQQNLKTVDLHFVKSE